MPCAYDRLPLGALRVFEAVATHLSFSAAADALNVAQSSLTDISELVTHATLRLIKAEETVIQNSAKQQ